MKGGRERESGEGGAYSRQKRRTCLQREKERWEQRRHQREEEQESKRERREEGPYLMSPTNNMIMMKFGGYSFLVLC